MKNVIIFFLAVILATASSFTQITSWEKIDIPDDAPILDIAFTEDGTIYVCGTNVFSSTDNGKTWEMDNGLIYLGKQYEFDEMGITLNSLNIYNDEVFFLTINNQQSTSKFKDSVYWAINDTDRLGTKFFVSSSNYIYNYNTAYPRNFAHYSLDGNNWNDIDTQNDIYSIDEIDNKIYISSENSPLYIFEEKEDTLILQDSIVHIIYGNNKVDYFSKIIKLDEVLYAYSEQKGVLFKSYNEGEEWFEIEQISERIDLVSTFIFDNNTLVLFTKNNGMYFNSNNSNIWGNLSKFEFDVIYNVEVKNDKFYLCTNLGVYVSENAIDWNLLFDGSHGYPRSIISIEDNLFLSTFQNVYYQQDNSWVETNKKFQRKDNILKTQNNLYIMEDDSIFYSNDYAKNWQNFEVEKNYQFFIKMIENDHDELLILAYNYPDSHFVLKIKGLEADYKDLNDLENINQPINFHHSNGLYLIIDYNGKSYYSIDDMNSWVDFPINDIDNYIISDIYYDGQTIFIATRNFGMIKTDDFGVSIAEINNGFEELFENFVFGDQFFDLQYIENTLYLSTMQGVYYKIDEGNNWNQIDEIPKCPVQTIRYLEDGYFYAATSRGLYRSSEKVVSVEEQDNESEIAVYPNPVQDYIAINPPQSPFGKGGSELASRGITEIAIYNVLGEKVMTLSSAGGGGNEVAGGGQIRIDVSHLPTGMYFIKIGDKVQKFVKE